ncbi:two-component system, OmpR family, KDP operon response regulator KdpE [Granulicella rosea]|uniref:Two-component system, OmpR family, KDP operon response regulator KdpE n=1 Tax=Granulicella rosea TaxID=474952 RepID=A0A239EDL3_9BACT|nr:response regulator transcription factor [Granulicella rosea]SNS42736.1 two-component system, OmpR family, KDP operon response regulator KdpE [Granulicella rosea]
MDRHEGTVLLVEDDRAIRRGLRTTLSALGFELGEADSGEEALKRLQMATYDAVLMDLNMPGMGGVEACRRVRSEFPRISILVVTVRDSEEDKIEALDAGADDFITKPFKVGELAARIRAAVRRQRTPAQVDGTIHVGIFDLALERRSIKKRGQEIRLTPTEFDLLAYLMTHAGHPILHAKLLSAVWGPEYGDEREYLRTFILQLRRKLEDDPAAPVYLRTVNYLGYVFSDPANDES